MNDSSYDIACNIFCHSSADRLNSRCFCTTLNRGQLENILQFDARNQDILKNYPHLFSSTSVFISTMDCERMRNIIRAVSQVVKLPSYLHKVLGHAPEIAQHDIGTQGVFMGFDFHLSDDGPKIIEINTNAGGAFLNTVLLDAQIECCRPSGISVSRSKTHLEAEFMQMFFQEWRLARGNQLLKVIAIIDEDPQQQFLYPEFKIAQSLFEQQGIIAVIADPRELVFINGELRYQDKVIDLIYNRLTDFSLEKWENRILREAYIAHAVVVTPSPHHYAIYADKRNLITLSDGHLLAQLGADEKSCTTLQAGIPKTQSVTNINADNLWQERRRLFFKPATGFGSRAAYRGDKLTKRVWDEILKSDYVAQEIVVPSQRSILLDGQKSTLKVDIRAYTYAGEIQLFAARLYQGQTTNFRTQGGGFAPVFVVD